MMRLSFFGKPVGCRAQVRGLICAGRSSLIVGFVVYWLIIQICDEGYQFYYIKVGFKGVKLHRRVFVMICFRRFTPDYQCLWSDPSWSS